MAKKRRRSRGFGSSDQTHTRLARDYIKRAKRDFESAQQQENCQPALNRLIDAQSNYARAVEHHMALTNASEDRAMVSFGQKIHDAITKFGTGPCMRRSPYDK